MHNNYTLLYLLFLNTMKIRLEKLLWQKNSSLQIANISLQSELVKILTKIRLVIFQNKKIINNVIAI